MTDRLDDVRLAALKLDEAKDAEHFARAAWKRSMTEMLEAAIRYERAVKAANEQS